MARIGPQKAGETVAALAQQGQSRAEQEVMQSTMDSLQANKELMWATKGMIEVRNKVARGSDESNMNRCIKYVVGRTKSDGLAFPVIQAALAEVVVEELADLKSLADAKQEMDTHGDMCYERWPLPASAAVRDDQG